MLVPEGKKVYVGKRRYVSGQQLPKQNREPVPQIESKDAVNQINKSTVKKKNQFNPKDK